MSRKIRITVLALIAALAIVVVPSTHGRRRSRGEAQAVHRRLQAPRGDLRGEPQLRQPLRQVGKGRQGKGGRTEAGHGRHDPGRPGRQPDHVPAPERRQPHHDQPDDAVARRHHPPGPADPALLGHHCEGRGLRQPLHLEQAVLDQQVHQADRRNLRADEQVRGLRCPEGRPAGAARRLHPRHRAPLLPGAVPARPRQAGPLLDRQRRRGADPGSLRHQAAPGLRVPAQEEGAPLRDRRPLLPGRVRRLVPEPPVAHRGAVAAVGHQPERGAGGQEQRARQRRIPERRLPALHATMPAASYVDGPLTQACGLPTHGGRLRLRQLRRQHDAAVVARRARAGRTSCRGSTTSTRPSRSTRPTSATR